MNGRMLLAALILAASAIAGCATSPESQVQRFGSVIGVKKEKLEYYKELHAAPWAEVDRAVSESNIRNYSIYLRQMPDGEYYLFSYFEYVGDDFEGDMKKLGDEPIIKKWWKETDPCQKPLPNRKDGEWWAAMEEVYHLD